MKSYKKLIQTGALILGVFCLIAALSFVKVWMNDRDRAVSKSAGDTTEFPAPQESSGLEPTDWAPPESQEEPTAVPSAEVTPDPETEIISQTASGKELYHSLLTGFAGSTLTPLGFSLHSDEYIAAEEKEGSQNVIILYFSPDSKADFNAKKTAAIRLARFIFGEFEEKTGFETGYLKVHLKLPEGDSFALTRESYKKWTAAGGTDEELFEQYMGKMINPDSKAQEQTGEVFQAEYLEKLLNGLVSIEMKFTVKGDAKVDPGIYITMDKAKNELSAGDYEDVVVFLCDAVFRAYLAKVNQPVHAFKLMEPSGNVVFVIYRTDVDTLWPKGESNKTLRQFVRDGKTGPLS